MVSEGNNKLGGRISRRMVIAIVFLAVIATGTVLAANALHIFNLGCLFDPSSSTNQIHFTIIMSHQGFNDSKTPYPNSWPILNVAACQNVSVHLVNEDPTEPHGFAITHYFNSGVVVRPGQTDDVTFTANQRGTFLVYCNIFCTIHVYMLDGRLNVS